MIKSCKNCGRVYKDEQDLLNGTQRWRKCSAGHLWFQCNCGSTLLLGKDSFEDWYSPEKFLSDDARSVFLKLSKLQGLPHIDTSIMQLQVTLLDPDAEIKDLANAVKNEPFVATEVLQTSETIRSIRNPGQGPIHDIEHSIVYLGRKTLSEMVLTAAIKSIKIDNEAFDPEDFWQHAFLTASIAELVHTDRQEGSYTKDELYLASMLLNIGKIVSAICLPKEYAAGMDYNSDPKNSKNWSKVEKALGIINHTVLGEIAAAHWGLPVYVAETCSSHHEKVDANLRRARPGTFYTIAGLANQLSHWIMLRPERVDEDLLYTFAADIGWDKKKVEDKAQEFLTLKKIYNKAS